MKRTSGFPVSLALGFAALAMCACSSSNFAVPAASQDFASDVKYNNKVDILMVMDNSSSMLQYQNKFATETPGMLDAMNQLGLDYHIAMVTTDMRPNATGGKFVGTPAVLSATTSGLTAALQSRVVIGQAGSDLPRGFESMQDSLQPTYLAGAGAGFFRDDALLAVIVISNGDDYSLGKDTDYESFLDGLKKPFSNGAKSWILNYIGVLSPTGNCKTSGSFAEAGLKYMSVANYSSGVQASVCDSTLTTAVSNIRSRIVEILSEYQLQSVPDLSTVQVSMNGNPVPQDAVNGWTYDSVKNGIVFHGTFQPGVNDKLTVNYTPAEGT